MDKMSMEYVQNQYDMVIIELVLKESMEQMYNQIQQEVHWIELVRNEDQRFFLNVTFIIKFYCTNFLLI